MSPSQRLPWGAGLVELQNVPRAGTSSASYAKHQLPPAWDQLPWGSLVQTPKGWHIQQMTLVKSPEPTLPLPETQRGFFQAHRDHPPCTSWWGGFLPTSWAQELVFPSSPPYFGFKMRFFFKVNFLLFLFLPKYLGCVCCSPLKMHSGSYLKQNQLRRSHNITGYQEKMLVSSGFPIQSWNVNA